MDRLKSVLILALAALLLCGATAFAGGQKEKAAAPAAQAVPGQFPLQSPVTLKAGIGAVTYSPADIPVVKQWEKDTNVRLQWVVMETDEKRNILFASGDYPDFSFSTGLWANFLAEQLSKGVVKDLVPYLKKGYTPNLDRIFAKYPKALAYMVNPEGKLQALAKINLLEAWFIEQYLMVNRKWLDKVGMKKPETLQDLKQVLLAFRDKDPNGNGKKDELPMGFVALDGAAQHLMCLYGMWGMANKGGIVIHDGKASFGPIQPAYKDYIKYMADLYANGLIDPEGFTQSISDFKAKVENPGGELYGFIVSPPRYNATERQREFEALSPLKGSGYDPEIWVHPGYLAGKNVWFMTDKNKQPEITMAWVDRLYTLEQSVQAQYGLIGDGVLLSNGVYTPNPERDAEWRLRNSLSVFSLPAIFEADDYGARLAMEAGTAFAVETYNKYYKAYKAKEQWDRPEFTAAENTEVNKLKTDIEKLWKSKEAGWITGTSGVDAEWDGYVKAMQSLKIDRYVELHQAAHSRYLAAMKR